MHNLALLALLLGAEAPVRADTAVVCPPSFRAALQPWVKLRQSQGNRLHFLTNQYSAKSLREQLQRLHRTHRLMAVVLVGDVPQAGMTRQQLAVTVPTFHLAAKVNVHFGSEKHIASDNYFADLNGDQIPDVAVGRLSADTEAELTAIVDKLLSYERQAARGAWRRKIHMVAGVGGFGGLVDRTLEGITRKFIGGGIPREYRMSMTFASWRSPFCPDPRRFHQTTVNLLNDGCLFFVYVGHGQRSYLDYVRVPGAAYRILERSDAPRLHCDTGHPIAIFLACYTGAFDFREDCLAEELLRAPGGPVAVFAGSRVTMPYAMTVMTNGLMDEYFHKRRLTLGEILLGAKRQMVMPIKSANRVTRNQRQMADTLAGIFSPKPSLLKAERFEHLWLYNLLGDPLLRVPQPQSVKLAVDGKLQPGARVTVRGKSPVDGVAVLQLVSPREKHKHAIAMRRKYDNSDQALSGYQQVYRKANDWLWWQKRFEVTGGDFQVSELLPSEIKQDAVFRVIVQAKSGPYALGALEAKLSEPEPAADSVRTP